MRRSRLPLTALRAFEAAGRHGSFSRAADELAVSQAAISRQVRELEALLGRTLFDRGFRRVDLTEAGRRLLEQLTPSFDALAALLAELGCGPARMRVAVSVEPSFASLWLVPRLAALATALPAVDLQIEASNALAELRASGPTLAIRYAAQRTAWPRTEARRLVEIELTPMLAPALLDAGLSRPGDVLRHVLLNDETDEAWLAWLAAAGLSGAMPGWGPTFSDSAIALQSAERGHGIALGSRALADRNLAEGRLRAPFETTVARGTYWLLALDFAKLTDAETAFCDWLVRELNASVETQAAFPL